ncbi:hypothetical protein [Paludibaculum fermentans]|uniref:4-vinyl reductase 4VR domain-containing protein n=1 Tax=Paludibaculum fermentans TaxID=1473598 RepID=A0A7S7SII2_PALFE|nr:hypothetical protein [Paludibaculum fermentans]QOY87052.1 hypothetical protein IRI77_30445 [Paludibaculum fermentans]
MSINRKKVIENLSKIDIGGNQEGLIPAFGVFVNQLPAVLWNSFAERLTRQVGLDLTEAAEFLLVNAAHECGYHTGYGIITSEEWNAVIAPMVEQVPEDILHGAFAVLTAWGWAKCEIAELVPGERMVVRAYDYYEADIVSYGAASKPAAYMLQGISAAFMDLAYGGPYDVTGQKGMRTFRTVQTKGIECGHEYGEFVVTKS